MRLVPIDPPRAFSVGRETQVTLRHVANVELEPDELVTFVTASGTEHDVVRKSWGYYATASLNGRLRDHSLRAVLVRNTSSGRGFLLLGEAGKEKDMLEYLAAEQMEVVTWLDTDAAIQGTRATMTCEFCGSSRYRLVRTFNEPPPGETRFPALQGSYGRTLWQCDGCAHVVNETPIDPDALYDHSYVDATYGAQGGGLRASYDRIMGLPPASSDNHQRVDRVTRFARARLGTRDRVLDVGTGLGVFAAKMKSAGWKVSVIDPDPRAVAHAETVIGVRAIKGDFRKLSLTREYDLIAFNKVLEHVVDPVGFLTAARAALTENGLVYLEVPDGEEALEVGPEREEFFIEHRCAFSAASLTHLVRRSGFKLLGLERLHEPSGKYTLAAFIEDARTSNAPA